MDESSLLKWVESEVSYFMAKYGSSSIYEKGDLISEGWIVAKTVLTKFDKNNKASMKSFIQKCVKNRLLDITTSEAKKSARYEYEDIELEAPDFTSYVDLCISAEQKLRREDLSFLQDLCSGMSVRELRKMKGRRRCFHRILQSLKSDVVTQAA